MNDDPMLPPGMPSAIPCGCCGEIFQSADARLDRALGQVCPECGGYLALAVDLLNEYGMVNVVLGSMTNSRLNAPP